MKLKVVIVSSFIPIFGHFRISKISKEKALEILKAANIQVFSQHETVKILGLEPAKERITYEPNPNDIQIWIKPKQRLEFGREYSVDEIEKIGYDIWIAEPITRQIVYDDTSYNFHHFQFQNSRFVFVEKDKQLLFMTYKSENDEQWTFVGLKPGVTSESICEDFKKIGISVWWTYERI